MLEIFDEAVRAGARRARAAQVIGLSTRTLERWRAEGGGEDRRHGPLSPPANKLSEHERQCVLEIAGSPQMRDLSPRQIVPTLADRGEYVASEATFYRVLAEQGQNTHRQSSKPARSKPRELVATGPNQVWSWDITYLLSAVRGRFFFLYVILDVWSRKVVAWAIHEEENSEHAADLIEEAAQREGVARNQLTLHSDNGSPMKGVTMLAMLYWLGIAPSLSRPGVKNDNPYSESLFKTLKYRPSYPSRPFADVAAAHEWAAGFFDWYNGRHLHSGIRYVTPDDRHAGRHVEILAHRKRVLEAARKRHPERWTGAVRDCSPIDVVHLNPNSQNRAPGKAPGAG